MKRVFELAISLVMFTVLALPIIILSVLLMINNKGIVFFFQERTGINGKIFNIVKFKTMTDERDENGKLLPDEKRMTAIGRFVRSISLDELPQLLNVLNGDMSLVGPRPLLEKYIPLYTKEQFRRHQVKPGITGWAQVKR